MSTAVATLTMAPKKKRVNIPKQIEREILFRNQNVCCVCQKSSVQIHHIDEDPSNNEPSNLCVLCIEHHALASSKSNMTKGFAPALLRKYKDHWEAFLAHKRKVIASPRHRSGEGSSRIKFEIKRTVYALPGTRTKDQISSALDYLFRWHVLEGQTSYIVDTIGGMHWFLEPRQMQAVAKHLYELVFHFIGPDKVPMTKSDEKLILSVVELLGDLGLQSTYVGRTASVVRSIAESVHKISEIGAWYKRRAIIAAAAKQLTKTRNEWIDEKYRTPSKTIRAVLRIIDQAQKRIRNL